jgi:hypothetical protein
VKNEFTVTPTRFTLRHSSGEIGCSFPLGLNHVLRAAHPKINQESVRWLDGAGRVGKAYEEGDNAKIEEEKTELTHMLLIRVDCFNVSVCFDDKVIEPLEDCTTQLSRG